MILLIKILSIIAIVALVALAIKLLLRIPWKSYPLFIGSRYVQSKKKKTISAITLIAILGVSLGVTALSVVISISTGFQDEFTKKVLGVNAHVLVMKYGIDFSEYRDIMKTVSALPEVKGIEPFVIQEMMISHKDHTAGILLKGIDPNLVDQVLSLPKHIIDGSMKGIRIPGSKPPASPVKQRSLREEIKDKVDKTLAESSENESENKPENESENKPENKSENESENKSENESENKSENESENKPVPGIIIGKTLAENLDAKTGDIINITTPMIGMDVLGWAPTNETPKSISFKVIGIFYAGFLEYDTKLVFVDYFQAQRFFNQGDSVTGIEITLHDIHTAISVSQKIDFMLGSGPYHTVDWEHLNKPLFTALKTQKLVLIIVLAVIIGVAAFNIIATLVMMVFDKRREIAILKSMGATHFGILKIFMFVGTVVGVIGIAIGLVFGLGICLLLKKVGWPLDPEVYLIDHLPVTINAIDFIATAVVAFLICILATIAPSLNASKLRPVDGITQG